MSFKGFGTPPEDTRNMREQLNSKIKGLKRLLKSPVIRAGLIVPKELKSEQ
jgi:hypothetical protein